MYRSKYIFSIISLALLAAGFLFSFWPLSAVGLLLAAATGQYAIAIVIGLILDVLYGAPVGRWHFVHVPFTLLSLLACFAHYYLSAFMRKGDSGLL
jgi:hypothetical protein